MTSIIGNILDAIKRICQGPMTKSEVDRALNDLAEQRTERLAWRHSIVDLLKLLNLDTTMDARETLAQELGFPGEYHGTERDNSTLHKLVMEDVAKRYTRIPKS